jgi:hypothetical protein
MSEGFKFGPVIGEYAANRILCQDKEPQHADTFRIPLAEYPPVDPNAPQGRGGQGGRGGNAQQGGRGGNAAAPAGGRGAAGQQAAGRGGGGRGGRANADTGAARRPYSSAEVSGTFGKKSC